MAYTKKARSRSSGPEFASLTILIVDPNAMPACLITFKGFQPRQMSARNSACGACASSLPEAHAGLLGGFVQGSIFTAQHESSSLRQLEVGGVIDRQLVRDFRMILWGAFPFRAQH